MKQVLIFLATVSILIMPQRGFTDDTVSSFTCPERSAKPAKARKLAGTLFSEAEEAFEDEQFPLALEKFVCSLVMVEHPNTVINIERTLEQMADKTKALEILKNFETLRPESEMKTQIDALIVTTEAAIPVLIEEEDTEKCPEVEPVPPPPCPVVADPALEIEFLNRAQKLTFISGWSGVGVGAASFVAAVIFQALAGSAKNSASDAVHYDDFLAERDKSRSFQTAATTLFVSSVLTAGVGVAELILLSEQQKKYKHKKQGSKVSNSPMQSDKPIVSVAPGFGSFELEVTF